MAEVETDPRHSPISEGWGRDPLLDALIHRRSRRFGKSMKLNRGPLAYSSQHPPQPLTGKEDDAMAFAACEITGLVLAELPFQAGEEPEPGSGNIITHLVGRPVASGDAVHSGIVFLIKDDRAWMLKRPQDFPREQISELVQRAREHKFLELFEDRCVRIAERRLDRSSTLVREQYPTTA